MIIRFNENLQVEEIDAEESINAGNNLVNEIKVFMPSNFDFNIHKGYINFKLSDGKEYNNLVMERVKKENIQLVQEMCYYYVLPKFLTKQKGTIDLSVRISPISNTNVIANTGVIKAEINYAVFENGDEVLDPDTAEELRKDISESESSLKLYVQETIEDGYDLRVIGTVDSINDLPKNLTFNDVGISYFVGITYPRDVYTWGYLNDMELGWSNQGPLKVLSDDPVLEFANDEYEKSLNKFDEIVTRGNADNNTGTFTYTSTGNNLLSVNYMPMKPNTVYSYKTSKAGLWIYEYDSNRNFLGIIDITNGSSFTSKPTTAYFRVSFWGTYGTTYLNDTIVKEGTNPVYYPYNGPIIHEKDILSIKYLHVINLISEDYRIWLNVYNDRANAFTIIDFSKWLYEKGYRAISVLGNYLIANGGSRRENVTVCGISCFDTNGSNVYNMLRVGTDGCNNVRTTITEISDDVREIIGR